MSAEETKAVARRFFEFVASGEQDDVLIAPDIAYHGPPYIGEFQGREAFKNFLESFRRGFPGFETRVDDMIAEGDKVAVLHTHLGKHTGEFQGMAPTGKSTNVQGIEILRIRDGQVAEFWHFDDLLALMQQIGAVPAPEPAAVD